MASPTPAKKAKTAVAEGAEATPPPPLSITAVLEMDSLHDHDAYMEKWVAETKAYVDQTLLNF